MHPAHSVDNKVRIYQDALGRQWVTHEELLLCGYRNIEDFDIIYANGRFYELQAFTRKANSWWVEEVPIEETETYQPETYKVAEGQSPPVFPDARATGWGMRSLRKGSFLDPEA